MVMRMAAFALVVACGGAGPAVVEEGDGRGVLFVGNSLTYANDVPEMMRALALASAETLRVRMEARRGGAPHTGILAPHQQIDAVELLEELRRWGFDLHRSTV